MFCIRPIKLAPGVETIGELEMLDYLARSGDDDSILVIDSRIPDRVAKGTIPGSVNIPWTLLKTDTSDALTISSIITCEQVVSLPPPGQQCRLNIDRKSRESQQKQRYRKINIDASAA